MHPSGIIPRPPPASPFSRRAQRRSRGAPGLRLSPPARDRRARATMDRAPALAAALPLLPAGSRCWRPGAEAAPQGREPRHPGPAAALAEPELHRLVRTAAPRTAWSGPAQPLEPGPDNVRRRESGNPVEGPEHLALAATARPGDAAAVAVAVSPAPRFAWAGRRPVWRRDAARSGAASPGAARPAPRNDAGAATGRGGVRCGRSSAPASRIVAEDRHCQGVAGNRSGFPAAAPSERARIVACCQSDPCDCSRAAGQSVRLGCRAMGPEWLRPGPDAGQTPGQAVCAAFHPPAPAPVQSATVSTPPRLPPGPELALPAA